MTRDASPAHISPSKGRGRRCREWQKQSQDTERRTTLLQHPFSFVFCFCCNKWKRSCDCLWPKQDRHIWNLTYEVFMRVIRRKHPPSFIMVDMLGYDLISRRVLACKWQSLSVTVTSCACLPLQHVAYHESRLLALVNKIYRSTALELLHTGCTRSSVS